MSLTDKVIKNTFFFFISQVVAVIIPIFLTPFIVSKIGQVQFGIYALVLGFTGIFGLLDISLSSAFIKFISEYYNKKDYDELNNTINTGLFFYIFYSLIFSAIGFAFSEKIISLFNIPEELKSLSVFAFRISLAVFFINNAFGIFNSILVSLQKMYVTSILSIITSVVNFTLTILVILYGYGLLGIMFVVLLITVINTVIAYVYTKKELPFLKIGVSGFNKNSLKKMSRIGIQMQTSKVALFANEKYDEFLLGTMSILNNVTFYNMANRVTRYARLFPLQLYNQGAPIAAELNAKDEKEKLVLLLEDSTKYMSIISAPIFIFIFVFADLIITSWLGPGFELSITVLRILAFSQLINMIFSAPGNSIIPNIGYPKFQMYEGLMCLGLNIPLSYFLIKYYGILGAAYGNTISVSISSLYVFFTSIRFFKQKNLCFFKNFVIKPNLSAVVCALILFLLYKFFSGHFLFVSDRKTAILFLSITGVLFFIAYVSIMLKSKFFNERDRIIFTKIIYKILPIKMFNRDKTIV